MHDPISIQSGKLLGASSADPTADDACIFSGNNVVNFNDNVKLTLKTWKNILGKSKKLCFKNANITRVKDISGRQRSSSPITLDSRK